MADTHSLITRLRNLNSQEYDDLFLKQRDEWIKQVEELEAKRAIFNSFVVQDIIKELKDEIKNIDQMLLTKRKSDGFTEFERELELEKKIMYTKFVHRLNIDMQIEELGRVINDNL